VPPKGDIQTALTEIFRTVFNRDDLTLTPALTAKNVPGWDSFKQIEIILAVEELYGIELNSNEIDSLGTVGDLISVLTQRANMAAPRDAVDGLAHGDATPMAPGAPLSAEQRQIWLHAALAPDPALYNEQVAIRRSGSLDPAILEQSLNAIILRHASLRTVIATPGREVTQRVRAEMPFAVRFVDLRHLPSTERTAALERIATAEARKPFDLARGPLLRAVAVNLADNEHRLILTLHHLIIDSLSINRVLLPELSASYEAFADRRQPDLPPLLLDYADYAVWRQQQVQGKAIAARTKLWRRKLLGAPGTLPLPHDRTRPATLSYRGAVEAVEFSPELTRTLRVLAAREGVTLFMTLLAGLGALLHRYTGQDDILIGTVSSTRRRQGLDRLIGCFINLVALRTRPSADLSFRDHLAHVRQTVLSAFITGDVPFDQVVRELQPKREPSMHPLVQIVLSLETAEPAIGGWEVNYLDGNSGTSKFDVAISLHEHGNRVLGRLIYSTDLFDAATMRRLIGHWMSLLEDAAAHPGWTIGRLKLLTLAAIAGDPTVP
jgi:acyl carrier protein